MTIRHSASNAFVALFGTVTTSANVVTSAVNQLAVATDMLDTYTTNARRRQRINTTLSAEAEGEQILNRIAKEQAMLQRQLEQELSKDQRLAQLFNEHYTKLAAKLTEITA